MKIEPKSSAREVLAGLVERVTYQNAESGFCVVRVRVRGRRELVTLVGHAAAIAVGEWITATGNWVNDRTHGRQFKARLLKTSIPTSVDGIEEPSADLRSDCLVKRIEYARGKVRRTGAACTFMICLTTMPCTVRSASDRDCRVCSRFDVSRRRRPAPRETSPHSPACTKGGMPGSRPRTEERSHRR